VRREVLSNSTQIFKLAGLPRPQELHKIGERLPRVYNILDEQDVPPRNGLLQVFEQFDLPRGRAHAVAGDRNKVILDGDGHGAGEVC
jgi:hypothetical protein